ncbi:alpha/beta fold hydrolase [Paenibacillus woosongensis]|uniref:Alpha/beta fold hydrolase n=1 Tax=Paenibacillus woosongensis TaxID=307580 RepID=A0A7X3CLS9_9BACL|nr:alpha/beta hydrolase [Paenibacillus woosongensis]MUG43512.1 alpha/beta fold hydrolase [Paenibacillus woosongensis]
MSLFYIESGDTKAPLLVFLHGGGVSGWMWDKQIEHFQDYHCLVPDLPGHGQSSSIPFSISGSAEFIAKLIEPMAQGKTVVLIGFSLGAQVALQLLSMRPQAFDYAIINSALVRPIPLAKQIIGPSIKLTHWLMKNRSFSKLQAKQLYIGKDRLENYYQETYRMKAETLIAILQENMTFRIPEQFHQSSAKILVTVGEKEKKMMRKSAAEIAGSNSNCKSMVIPHIGHGVTLAQPELFNKIVESWIRKP